MDGPQSYGDNGNNNRSSIRNSLSSSGSGEGGIAAATAAARSAFYRRSDGSAVAADSNAVATEMSTVSQSFLYYQQQQNPHRQSTTDFQCRALPPEQQQLLAAKATIQEHHPSTTYPRHQVQLPAQQDKKHIRYQPIQYQIEYEKQQFSQQQQKNLQHRSSVSGADEVAVSLISSSSATVAVTTPSPLSTIVTIGHDQEEHDGIVAVAATSSNGGRLGTATLPISSSSYHPQSILRSATSTINERRNGGGGGGMADENYAEEGDGGDANTAGSEEMANSQTGSTTKRSRSKHRPLFRRLFHYVRNTLIGQKSKGDADECEVYELPPRYRPESVSSLCRITRFSEEEVKRLYRGFKAECPSGVVREDTFKIIYSQFFSARANTGNYAHFVFNTLDQDNSGIINFEDFLQTLSILSRGTMEEKLTWTFALYDINGDGCVTREEMTDIVTAIYDMVDRPSGAAGDLLVATQQSTTTMATTSNEVARGGGAVRVGSVSAGSVPIRMDGDKIKQKVDQIFQKMDTNQDGVVTLDEFISCCRNDEVITNSMMVFDNIVL